MGALFGVVSLLAPGGARGEDFQGSTHRLDFDSAPINYSESVPRDPVSRAAAVLQGDPSVKPVYDRKSGYLPAVLRMLGVSASSQMLVFSKTSLQRGFIRPDNARALYFSDDVYVGYVPGAPVLEIAAVDPRLGAVFYTVEQDRQKPLVFERNMDCLGCHGASRSMGVPGFVLRSLETERDGDLIAGTETSVISHFTPIEERWGGWYVTEAPEDWRHRGNKFAGCDSSASKVIAENVDGRVYPGRGSHVLPLLVHDHQTHMHNYFTRLSFEARRMISTYGHIRYLKNPVEAFLRYLLFVQEAPLPSAVPSNEEFIHHFQENARRDSRGRSLRDFDLQTRLFKYPCSFLIESDSFRDMPEALREVVLRRLWEILTGRDESSVFNSIPAESRRAVFEMLRELLSGLPAYWHCDEAEPAKSEGAK